ncbi:MAG: TfoX/Sxy family protein [Planctomycetes bacterium]|nr:TfoX/Sxy family protein [Planctomycetota bacterium]
MAYDEKLALRLRRALKDVAATEKHMFGGLALMVRGHMACGIIGEKLMVRVGPEAHEGALKRPCTAPMDFNGKPMKGMVYVTGRGATGAALKAWVALALKFNATLPPK